MLFRSPLILPIILYVLVFLFSCFVGLINDAHPAVVVFRFFRTVLFFYIFFIVFSSVKTRKQFQQLIIIMLICFTLVAAFGVLQYILGQTWADTVNQKVFRRVGYPEAVNYVAGEGVGQVYRANSSLLHPNVLGGFLVLALPFFVSLLWCYRRLWMRLLLLMGIALNLGCLYLSGSRAA